MKPPKTSPFGRPILNYEQLAAILLLTATLIFCWTVVQWTNYRLRVSYTPRKAAPYQQQVLAAQTEVPQPPTSGTTSTDDDPVLGVQTAPVTMVGFVDYECPFCRKFFLQTLPVLREKFVQTGQLKIVMRDLPILFHEPAATLEALAANCARQQGGDELFFKFQEQIYKATHSNGQGLQKSELEGIASVLGLKSVSFLVCLDDPAVLAEINQDIQAADALGVLGTPTFLIGKTSSDGAVTGELVLGAQSVEDFEAAFARQKQ